MTSRDVCWLLWLAYLAGVTIAALQVIVDELLLIVRWWFGP